MKQHFEGREGCLPYFTEHCSNYQNKSKKHRENSPCGRKRKKKTWTKMKKAGIQIKDSTNDWATNPANVTPTLAIAPVIAYAIIPRRCPAIDLPSCCAAAPPTPLPGNKGMPPMPAPPLRPASRALLKAAWPAIAPLVCSNPLDLSESKSVGANLMTSFGGQSFINSEARATTASKLVVWSIVCSSLWIVAKSYAAARPGTAAVQLVSAPRIKEHSVRKRHPTHTCARAHAERDYLYNSARLISQVPPAAPSLSSHFLFHLFSILSFLQKVPNVRATVPDSHTALPISPLPLLPSSLLPCILQTAGG